MFWVRRAVALVVLVLVVGVLVVGVKAAVPGISSALGGGGEQPVVVVTETPTASPTPTGPIGDCAARDVEASVTPTPTTVAWGSDVAFRVTVRNVGDGPCVVDAGNDARAVVVTDASATPSGGTASTATPSSGTKPRQGEATATPTTTGTASKQKAGDVAHVWSSADCASDQRLLLLGPGDVDTATVTWHRERSVKGCATGLGEEQVGTFRVAVTVLGVTSDPVAFTLAPKPAPAPAVTTPPTGTGTADEPAATPTRSSETTKGAAGKATGSSSPKPSSKPSSKG
ncbi:hypothetical protein [Luteimicrobium subarcticum]|uniref:DUF4232 domain-containing protein n=1 Tax=Luteimicrobium subarcticum TaxID=620910 RepID=A0A2M8WVU8_9MICO|nr:hypothetical protein [Luteimicrobium subarcticum]PJI95050.1 hypothetical protein CLV34_0903 [Luteimicrobium subarcticum]